MSIKCVGLFVVASLSGLLCYAQPSVRARLEAQIKPRLDNPGSYEFVSLSKIGTVTIGNNLQDLEHSYGYTLGLAKSFRTPEEQATAQAPVDELHRIRQNFGADTARAVAFRYLLTFRARNSFNAKVLNQYIVNTTPGQPYKVLDMGRDWYHVDLHPGGFPGRAEFYSKYPR